MEQTAAELVEWAKAHGGEISSGIDFVQDQSKGICAVCSEEVPNATVRVPEDIIIGAELAAKHFPTGGSQEGNTWLKFLLCKFKFQEDQPFGPYIRNLPQRLDSPLVWNPAEWQLLQGTNMGSSIKEKLHTIFTEWHDWILKYPQVFGRGAVVHDIELYENFDSVGAQQLYQEVLDHAASGKVQVWYSFGAFLWAHLILLSRAFPEYIIHPQCNECAVMLLPFVDLLNHDHHSKVKWYASDGYFCYEKLDPTSAGQELCNNYGPKGNEELLAGYGFVQEDNEFDYVALKIMVPIEVVQTILETEPSLQLPTLDDYTTFAFEKPVVRGAQSKADPSYFAGGVRYFINARNDDCLHPLLDLFAYLSKGGGEEWIDLRPRLQGLQSLRAALLSKLEHASLMFAATNSEASTIDPYRRHCAEVYRAGQCSVLKRSIASLKAIEKNLLTQYKDQLLNWKKIIKKDVLFAQDELPSLFEGQDENTVSFDDTLELIVLWVTTKIKYKTFNPRHKWAAEQFDSFMQRSSPSVELSPDAEALYSHLFPQDKAKVSLGELNAAYRFVLANSFTRSSSSNETILVKNGTR